MTDKALKVLHECIDHRSGRRFKPGETFEPVPGVEQAKRLITAGCLPREAYDLAIDAEKATEEKELSALDLARKDVETADQAVADAQTALDAAADADKPAAQKTLDEAKAKAKEAQSALKKLSK